MPDYLQQLNTYRFHPSMRFEAGMREALGREAYQTAGYAGMPKYAKRVMLKALNKFEKRLDELCTMDERLRDRLSDDFETLRKQLKSLDTSCNEMDIIGTFFQIVSRLLGYDWQEGKIYRTPVYFQTKQQHLANYENRYPTDWHQREANVSAVGLQRCKIARQLQEQGLHINQIARVLNATDYSVRQMLRPPMLDRIVQLQEDGLDFGQIRDQLHREGHKQSEIIEMLDIRLRRLGTPSITEATEVQS